MKIHTKTQTETNADRHTQVNTLPRTHTGEEDLGTTQTHEQHINRHAQDSEAHAVPNKHGKRAKPQVTHNAPPNRLPRRHAKTGERQQTRNKPEAADATLHRQKTNHAQPTQNANNSNQRRTSNHPLTTANHNNRNIRGTRSNHRRTTAPAITTTTTTNNNSKAERSGGSCCFNPDIRWAVNPCLMCQLCKQALWPSNLLRFPYPPRVGHLREDRG